MDCHYAADSPEAKPVIAGSRSGKFGKYWPLDATLGGKACILRIAYSVHPTMHQKRNSP
jgi:hypothetical protein